MENSSPAFVIGAHIRTASWTRLEAPRARERFTLQSSNTDHECPPCKCHPALAATEGQRHTARAMSTATLQADDGVHGIGAATRLIIAASVGNALEFYEILVYGYFAVIVAKVFFPAADEAVSLLVTLGSFGISFLARPVGAIFLGAYGDRKGAEKRADAVDLSDDNRHRADDDHAELWRCRHSRAYSCGRRAASSGLFGRRRIRELDRVPRRAPPGPRRLLRQL